MSLKLNAAEFASLLSFCDVNDGIASFSVESLRAEVLSVSRQRVSDKAEKFTRLIASVQAEIENGTRAAWYGHTPRADQFVLRARDFDSVGLPASYGASASMWAGLAEASRLAYAHGFRASMLSVRDAEGDTKVAVQLTRATDAELSAHKAKVEADAAKASKSKADPAEPQPSEPGEQPSEQTEQTEQTE